MQLSFTELLASMLVNVLLVGILSAFITSSSTIMDSIVECDFVHSFLIAGIIRTYNTRFPSGNKKYLIEERIVNQAHKFKYPS